MRHGRLASALALAAFTGLAAGQSRPTEFGIDREPDAPAPAARLLPAAVWLTPAVTAADAQDKGTATDQKAPPNTDKPPAPADKVPMTIPPAAGATPPPPVTTLPPTAVSVFPRVGPAVPPGGVVLPPDGGTVVFSETVAVDPNQFWVSAEALWWRIRKDSVPPLVTTGPAAFPVGFLGNAGTSVLFAGRLDQDTFTGARVRAGMWLDACHTIGLEASGFWLPQQSNSTTFTSGQFPVLARPFTDVNPGGPNSEFLAFPGLATGAVTVSNETRFCGATLAARCPVCCNCWGAIDGLVGLQYLNLEEKLTIVETPRGTPNNPFPGGANTQFIAVDEFQTRNQFYGGFVGLDAHANYGCWVFGAYGTIGLGCNQETVEISGSQTAIPAGGAATTTAGGLLALPGANIGRFTKNEFSTVSELGLTVGYQITPNIQVFGGYTFLYWTNVVRPGSEIDPVLDVNRIPNFGGGPAATSHRPIVPFNQTDFWAQGVSAGIRFSW